MLKFYSKNSHEMFCVMIESVLSSLNAGHLNGVALRKVDVRIKKAFYRKQKLPTIKR